MTPSQVAAARKLLAWSPNTLAVRSNTTAYAVTVFERTGRVARMSGPNQYRASDVLSKLQAALEAAGVVFTNGDEPGVKLRKST